MNCFVTMRRALWVLHAAMQATVHGFHSLRRPSSLYVAIRFSCGWWAMPITSFSWTCGCRITQITTHSQFPIRRTVTLLASAKIATQQQQHSQSVKWGKNILLNTQCFLNKSHFTDCRLSETWQWVNISSRAYSQRFLQLSRREVEAVQH